MPLVELLICATLLIQGFCLAFSPGSLFRRLSGSAGALGLSAAALALALQPGQGAEPAGFGLLVDIPLFRLTRAAMLFSIVVTMRLVAATRELPERKKPEAAFLLSFCALLFDLLLLSNHQVLTVLLLALGAWSGIFLGGLAYRGRSEGEAILKYWIQSSLALALSFGALVFLILFAGGGSYERLGQWAQALPSHSVSLILAFSAVYLPFILFGGLFPFHFLAIDRDHGVPWPVQALFSVSFQGCVAVAIWKVGVMVFGVPGAISDGMRVVQLCGLAGGVWLGLFALSQVNAKRLYSSMIGLQWGIVLAASALPSVLSAATIQYVFSSVFLWGALLAVVWARFQELAASEGVATVFGAARTDRVWGLLLLLAIASPLCVPGFPGLPGALHLLATMVEQRSLVFLLGEIFLLGLLFWSALRIGSDLLFRDPAPRAAGAALIRPAASLGGLDLAIYCGALGAVLWVGLAWNTLMVRLHAAAEFFLRH